MTLFYLMINGEEQKFSQRIILHILHWTAFIVTARLRVCSFKTLRKAHFKEGNQHNGSDIEFFRKIVLLFRPYL